MYLAELAAERMAARARAGPGHQQTLERKAGCMNAASPVPLVPDRLYALGGSIPNDGRISWLDGQAGGWEPLNAYMAVEGSAAYLIDTQLPIVEAEVRDQARELRHRHSLTDVTLFLTRVPEFESLGNAEILERVLPFKRVYAAYTPEEWLYFRGVAPRPDRLGYEPMLLEKGATIEWVPGRPLTTLGAPLRLLAASWAYEHESRTLFTSDGFSHAHAESSDQRVLTAAEDSTTEDDVRDHLLRKFDYLEGANTGAVRAALDAIFSTYEVERIAPSHGLILEGADLVQRHAGLVDNVLAALGQTHGQPFARSAQ